MPQRWAPDDWCADAGYQLVLQTQSLQLLRDGQISREDYESINR